MAKLKVAVLGANGRMGKEIAEILNQSKPAEASLGIVRKGKAEGFKKSANSLVEKDFKDIDVIIDFSSIEAMPLNISFAVKEEIPMVSGITGIGSKEQISLEKAAKKIPLLWAPNMSLGVAALAKALESLAAIKDFDFQVEEFHHNKKKDSPSGTALFIQQHLEKAVGKKCPTPLSIRGGGIFGIHKVYAMSDNEVITFEHSALNRRLFAEGAVKAALWLARQKKGLYQMQDLMS